MDEKQMTDEPSEPDYSDCSSPGEVKMIWKEEHLCLRCHLSPICIVSKAVEDCQGVFPVVSRCATFTTGD